MAMQGHLPVIPWVEIDVPVWDPPAVVPEQTKRLAEVKWAFPDAIMQFLVSDMQSPRQISFDAIQKSSLLDWV